MTLSAGTSSEDNEKPEGETTAGTSLTPAEAGPAAIDPFLAAASETPGTAKARSFQAKLLDYSAHAAMIVGLVGVAWTVGEHVVNRPSPARSEAPVKVAAASISKVAVATKLAEVQKTDEIAELRRANREMTAEIRGLHASLEGLRSTVTRTRTPDEVRALTAGLDTVKNGLANAKSETGAQIAQLSGRIDKLQRDMRPQVADRAGKTDHQSVDMSSTGSIPPAQTNVPKSVPTPPAKPNALASVDQEPAKPPVIAGWVVRDVYEGVALIEGKRGPMEVVPGVSIPGAGVVKSIERHGGGWTVTTTKGLLAYAAPPRDYRRPYGREYYPSRRYDF